MRLGVLGGFALLSACGFSGASAPGDADRPDPLVDGSLVDAVIDGSLVIDGAVLETDGAVPGPAWAFRRRLDIDNAGQGAFTNFVLAVHLDPGRFSYGNAQASGADLRFGSADGQFYPYELERWTTNGSSLAWVRVPTIAAGTVTEVYVYYGNPNALDAQDRGTVWSDSNYVGVWHLDGATDATGRNQSTNMGSTTVEGRVGRAADFSGANQYIDTLNTEHLTSFTIEAWIKPDTNPTPTGARAILSRFPNYMLLWACDNVVFCRTVAFNGPDSGDGTFHAPFDDATTGVWSHVVARRDANGLRTWVNGVASGVLDATDTPINTTVSAKIGARPDATGFFDGQIDELRISRNARTADYIRAHYKSTADTLLTYGPEEANPNP